MANLHLVTGYAGYEHIKATDQAAFNAALIGTGQFVLEKGGIFEAQVHTNNLVRVLDGELMMQGRFIRLDPDTYVDLEIENGEQGKLRNDIIVARYTKDIGTGVEECNLVVIKGEAVASNPVDPAYTEGDITNGVGTVHDYPLWRIPIDGLNVGEPVALYGLPFKDSMHTLHSIREDVNAQLEEQKVYFAEQEALYEAAFEEQNEKLQKAVDAFGGYTKTEVLTDEVKAKYGKDSTAVPNDLFKDLADSPNKIGDIKTTIRTDLGDHWLLCNGESIDQTAHPDLYDMTPFSIYNQFVSKGVPSIAEGDTIVDMYVDTDCTVIASRDSDYINMTLWWKRHTETVWNSKVVYTRFSGAYKVQLARISLANGYLCVLITQEYTSGGYSNTYYTWCSKEDFNWAETASANTVQFGLNGFTPIRYLNGYYVYAHYQVGTSYHIVKMYSTTDITTGGTFAAPTYGATSCTAPIDITYTDGYYRIICGSGTSYSTMTIAYSEDIKPTTNTSKTANGNLCGTNFATGTDYWASNDADGNLRLMKRTTTVVNFGFVATPIKIDMVGEDVYILCTDCFVKYNIATNSRETAELNFADAAPTTSAERGFVDFANDFVGAMASDGEYYESAKSLPIISPNGAFAYIKAKE